LRRKNDTEVIKDKLSDIDDSEFDADFFYNPKRITCVSNDKVFQRTQHKSFSKAFLEKKKLVDISREEIERKEQQKRFLSLYKKEIIYRYKEILKEKTQELYYQKQSTKDWIKLINLYSYSKWIINKFYVLHFHNRIEKKKTVY